eukprot:g2370.t1
MDVSFPMPRPEVLVCIAADGARVARCEGNTVRVSKVGIDGEKMWKCKGRKISAACWIESSHVAVGFRNGVCCVYTAEGGRVLAQRCHDLAPLVAFQVTRGDELWALHSDGIVTAMMFSAAAASAGRLPYRKWKLKRHGELRAFSVCRSRRIISCGTVPFCALSEKVGSDGVALQNWGGTLGNLASAAAKRAYAYAPAWLTATAMAAASSGVGVGMGADGEDWEDAVADVDALLIDRRVALHDSKRLVMECCTDPTGRYVAMADSLARVTVVDSRMAGRTRVFKGYRDAQCAFMDHRGGIYLAIYSLSRASVEVYRMFYGPLVRNIAIAGDRARLLYHCSGRAFMLHESPRLEISGDREQPRGQPAAGDAGRCCFMTELTAGGTDNMAVALACHAVQSFDRRQAHALHSFLASLKKGKKAHLGNDLRDSALLEQAFTAAEDAVWRDANRKDFGKESLGLIFSRMPDPDAATAQRLAQIGASAELAAGAVISPATMHTCFRVESVTILKGEGSTAWDDLVSISRSSFLQSDHSVEVAKIICNPLLQHALDAVRFKTLLSKVGLLASFSTVFAAHWFGSTLDELFAMPENSGMQHFMCSLDEPAVFQQLLRTAYRHSGHCMHVVLLAQQCLRALESITLWDTAHEERQWCAFLRKALIVAFAAKCMRMHASTLSVDAFESDPLHFICMAQLASIEDGSDVDFESYEGEDGKVEEDAEEGDEEEDKVEVKVEVEVEVEEEDEDEDEKENEDLEEGKGWMISKGCAVSMAQIESAAEEEGSWKPVLRALPILLNKNYLAARRACLQMENEQLLSAVRTLAKMTLKKLRRLVLCHLWNSSIIPRLQASFADPELNEPLTTVDSALLAHELLFHDEPEAHDVKDLDLILPLPLKVTLEEPLAIDRRALLALSAAIHGSSKSLLRRDMLFKAGTPAADREMARKLAISALLKEPSTAFAVGSAFDVERERLLVAQAKLLVLAGRDREADAVFSRLTLSANPDRVVASLTPFLAQQLTAIFSKMRRSPKHRQAVASCISVKDQRSIAELAQAELPEDSYGDDDLPLKATAPPSIRLIGTSAAKLCHIAQDTARDLCATMSKSCAGLSDALTRLD